MEDQIQALTQKLVGEQIGDLVLAIARLRAEAIVRAQQATAVVERSGTGDGAQGADGLPKESSDHG